MNDNKTKILFKCATYHVSNEEQKEDFIVTIGFDRRISLRTKGGDKEFIFDNSDPARIERMAKMMLAVSQFAVDMKDIL